MRRLLCTLAIAMFAMLLAVGTATAAPNDIKESVGSKGVLRTDASGQQTLTISITYSCPTSFGSMFANCKSPRSRPEPLPAAVRARFRALARTERSP